MIGGREAAAGAASCLRRIWMVVLCAGVVVVFLGVPFYLVLARACGWWPFA